MSNVTATKILNIARGWLGYSEANGKYRQIMDVYNGHKPLARGYAIQPDDEWCDCFVSAVAIKAGAVDIIGTEVGCEKHVDIFKKKGIWIEDGKITPKPGDIILFNWEDGTQPNDGRSNHIGYVEKVEDGKITCIEGNKGAKVARRTINVGWGYIRGYARPKYASETAATPKPETTTTTAKTTIKKGDVVTVKDGATWYNSERKVPGWVKDDKWVVASVKGDRAVIDDNVDGTNSIESPIDVDYLKVVTSAKVDTSFTVKVGVVNLNIRTGPGTNYKKTGRYIETGKHVITETKKGTGSKAGWGKLADGRGWISLDYATKL